MSWETLLLGIFLGYGVGFVVDLIVTHRKLREADRRILELEEAPTPTGTAIEGDRAQALLILEEEVAALRDQNAQLDADRAQLIELARSIEPLKAELADLKGQSARFADLEERANALRAELEQARLAAAPGLTDAEGEELRSEISRLWAKLEVAEQERRSIEADRDRLMQERATLAARLEPQALDDLQRELSEARSESQSLRREFEATNSDLDTLRSAYSEIEADRGRLAAELEGLRSQAAIAGEQRASELSQAEELAERWRLQAEEVQRTMAESAERHAAESASLRERLKELEASAGARTPDEILLAERDLALAERDRLQAQVIEAEARVRLARLESGQGDRASEAHAQLERQLAEERRALQTALDELAKVRGEKEAEPGDAGRVSQLESQLRQADRVIEDLRSQIARLEYSSRQARPSQNGNGGHLLEPLAVVPGLTKFAERRLHANGVLSLSQLAALDIHDPVIDPELKSEFPDLAIWIEHARRLTQAARS